MEKKIKVAIVASSLCDWGGPEVMVQNLVDELLKRKDVEVTLFAPGDWKTKAKHVVTLEQSLLKMKDLYKLSKMVRQNLVLFGQLKILDLQDEFDIIHLNFLRCIYPIGKIVHRPCIFTLHGKMKKDIYLLAKEAKVKIVFLTKEQRGDYEGSVINNGVPVNKIEYNLNKGEYLISIARLTPQKGVDRAIQIAKKAKMRLLIFGRKHRDYMDYFNEKIKPFIDGKNIIYKKEVPHNKIYKYCRKAKALLFPISESEPFGMVIAEALASGTPVIGTKVGQMLELLGGNEKIAYLSNDTDDLVKVVKETDERFDRQECRNYAENNFSSAKMADEYVKVYQRILKLKK